MYLSFIFKLKENTLTHTHIERVRETRETVKNVAPSKENTEINSINILHGNNDSLNIIFPSFAQLERMNKVASINNIIRTGTAHSHT